jgi:hypothetical protein
MPRSLSLELVQEMRSELEKIASMSGHWRTLRPDQKGHDRQGNQISGRTWVAGASAGGVLGSGYLSSRSADSVNRKMETPKKVLVYHTDPLRGAGHLSQGKALVDALKRKGVDAELRNFDKEFVDPKMLANYNAAFKQYYENPTRANSLKNIKAFLATYHTDKGINSEKMVREMTAPGVLPVFANIQLGWTAQTRGVDHGIGIHTDQAPWKNVDPEGGPVGRGMRHVAVESAAGDVLEQHPTIAHRLRVVPDLPIQPLTSGPMIDGISGETIKMDGKYNITVSGGALGLDTDDMLGSLVKSDLPKGTVIHVVTGGQRDADGKLIHNPSYKAAKAVKIPEGLDVRVYGWAPLRQMMSQADVNILRPHGTTITEATASGRPFIMAIPDNAREMDVDNARAAARVVNQPISRISEIGSNTVEVLKDPEPYQKALEKRAPLAANAADSMAEAVMSFDSWKVFPKATRLRGMSVAALLMASIAGLGWSASRKETKKDLERIIETPTAKSVRDNKAAKIGFATLGAGLIAVGALSAARAKHLRGLERLTPKVSVTNVKRFEEMLEPGDIILQQMNVKKLPALSPGKLRYSLMRQSQTEFVHTVLYLGEGKVIHIHPSSKKPVMESVDRLYRNGTELLAIRPKESKETLAKVVDLAKKSEVYNNNFNMRQSIKVALLAPFPKFIRRHFTQIKDGKVLCSTMVADIFDRAGASLPKSPGDMLTVDFRSMDNPPVVQLIGKKDRIHISGTQGLGFVIGGSALTLPAAADVYGRYKTKKASISIGQAAAFWDELDKIASVDVLTGGMASGKTTKAGTMRDKYDLVVHTDVGRVVNGRYVMPPKDEKERIRAERQEQALEVHRRGGKVLLEGDYGGVRKFPQLLAAADSVEDLDPGLITRFMRTMKRSGIRGSSRAQDAKHFLKEHFEDMPDRKALRGHRSFSRARK